MQALQWRFVAALVSYATNVREILKQLADGDCDRRHDSRKSSPVEAPDKPGRVTVHGKPGDSIAPGTLNSILKQSGLKK